MAASTAWSPARAEHFSVSPSGINCVVTVHVAVRYGGTRTLRLEASMAFRAKQVGRCSEDQEPVSVSEGLAAFIAWSSAAHYITAVCERGQRPASFVNVVPGR
jgi:hypothetical protein